MTRSRSLISRACVGALFAVTAIPALSTSAVTPAMAETGGNTERPLMGPALAQKAGQSGVVAECNYADPNSAGQYKDSLCWLNFSYTAANGTEAPMTTQYRASTRFTAPMSCEVTFTPYMNVPASNTKKYTIPRTMSQSSCSASSSSVVREAAGKVGLVYNEDDDSGRATPTIWGELTNVPVTMRVKDTPLVMTATLDVTSPNKGTNPPGVYITGYDIPTWPNAYLGGQDIGSGKRFYGGIGGNPATYQLYQRGTGDTVTGNETSVTLKNIQLTDSTSKKVIKDYSIVVADAEGTDFPSGTARWKYDSEWDKFSTNGTFTWAPNEYSNAYKSAVDDLLKRPDSQLYLEDLKEYILGNSCNLLEVPSYFSLPREDPNFLKTYSYAYPEVFQYWDEDGYHRGLRPDDLDRVKQQFLDVVKGTGNVFECRAAKAVPKLSGVPMLQATPPASGNLSVTALMHGAAYGVAFAVMPTGANITVKVDKRYPGDTATFTGTVSGNGHTETATTGSASLGAFASYNDLTDIEGTPMTFTSQTTSTHKYLTQWECTNSEDPSYRYRGSTAPRQGAPGYNALDFRAYPKEVLSCTVTYTLNEKIPTTGSVAWHKTASDTGKALGGATFDIRGPGYATTVTDNVSATDADTSVGGFRLVDLKPGKYTMTERTAPAGYVKSTATYTFTVTAGVQAAVTGPGVTNSTIVNQRQNGSVAWEKTNESGTRLAKSSWTVSGPNGYRKTIVDNDASDADKTAGKIRIASLVPGSYTIVESAAPAGYYRNTQVYSFTVAPGKAASISGVSKNVFVDYPIPTKRPSVPKPPVIISAGI